MLNHTNQLAYYFDIYYIKSIRKVTFPETNVIVEKRLISIINLAFVATCHS